MNQPPSTIVKQLRALMPMRPLSLSDAYALAELQASKTVGLLGVQQFQAVGLDWITHLPRLRVVPRPRHEMPNLSGFTQWENGAYLVVINRSDGRTRRRFTLAHEIGHLCMHEDEIRRAVHVDKRFVESMLRRDSRSSRGTDEKEIEANQFAAALLMPAPTLLDELERTELDVEDERALDELARCFKVSKATLQYRIRNLAEERFRRHHVASIAG